MATFRYDPETKEMVCISIKNGRHKPHVWMPKDSIHSGHYFENLGMHIRSPEHKRQVLKEKGWAEAG